MGHSMKIVLVAVPGSGKSTTMSYIKKLLPDVKIVNYGDIMLEIAKEKYGVSDRDEMRRVIPVDEYRKIQVEAAKRIGGMRGDIIIDTHLTIKMRGGFYPGLPNDVMEAMNPDMIVIMEYRPQDVIERRLKDLKGIRTGRDIEKPEEIELQQEMNRYFAAAAANHARCIVRILNLRYEQRKPFEHVEKAAKEIVNILLKERGLKNDNF